MRFANYERLASRAVDRVFGEAVRVDPQAGGRFTRGSLDPDRASFSAVAAVDFNPVIVTTRRHEEASAELTGDRAHASFGAPSLPVQLRPGDRIVLLERDELALIIRVVEPDGLGRVLCRCVPAGPAGDEP
ncbi:MAG TPA: hypothetical protein VLA00_16370 [Xanthobacteraceae bacterium]|nr:hypothetical protein [Xanthobacteraceae bacterium]